MFGRSLSCVAAVVAFSSSLLSAAGPLGSFDDWKPSGGNWVHRKNVFAQIGNNENCRVFYQNPKWTDYTYELQARKISGDNGFTVFFRSTGSDSCYHWVLGGWANKSTALGRSGLKRKIVKIPGPIRTGKWYDIKIVAKGPLIRCYLNRRLVHSVRDKGIKSGGIGLGCWKTQVQYRNIKVTSSKGKLLYLTRKTSYSPPMSVFTEKQLTPAEKAEKARLEALEKAAAKLSAKLIEPFEDLTSLEVTGSVEVVDSGPGVTQGGAAVRLSPESAVQVSFRGSDVAVLPWLRFDTHHTGDQAQPLRISTGIRERTGYVRAGADTLRYPLVWMIKRSPRQPDTRMFTLRITNVSDTAVVLDNLRLEPRVHPPPGAVMWDYGPPYSAVWLGFTRQYRDHSGLQLVKGPELNHHRRYHPDPLTGDFVGTKWDYFGMNMIQSIRIITPQAKSMTAWVWLTHYGHRYVQPREYVFRPPVGRAITSKLKTAELLGDKCLLHGYRGAWTGQWYSREYCDRLVTLTSFPVTKDKNVVELGNCQIAAIAMAPTSNRTTMAVAVKRIDAELKQYRRQFSMGRLEPNACKLKPTEAETETGVMLFRVPVDEVFTGTWKPRGEQRLRAINDICRPGRTLRIPLAFVPLKKKFSTASITVGSLRSENGAVLSLGKGSVRVDFLHPVPSVQGNVAISRPWIISTKAPAVEAGKIGYAWISVTIPPKTKGDLYKGLWRINCGRIRAEIPVMLDIVGSPPLPVKKMDVISWRLPYARDVYPTVYSSLPEPRRQALQNEVFAGVTSAGVNTFMIQSVLASAPDSNGKRYLSFKDINDTLKRYPFKGYTGRVIFHLGRSLKYTGWGRGSSDRKHLQRAISATNELRAEHGIAEAYFDFGFSVRKEKNEDGIGLLIKLSIAGRMAGKNCKVIIGTTSTVIEEFQDDEFAKKFRPVSALILNPNSSSATKQIASFKKLGDRREVFLTVPMADRFSMGFYPAIIGADGVIFSDMNVVMPPGGPYCGHSINGHGLVSPQAGGELAQTASAIRIHQANDDFELFAYCLALADHAKSTKVPATEILELLEEIRSRTLALKMLKELEYNSSYFSTMDVSHAEMDSWRTSLLNAIGIVSGRLKQPRR
jgi:hypothetical protein